MKTKLVQEMTEETRPEILVAKAIRRELKERFPNTKFSVRKATTAAWAPSVMVSWKSTVTAQEVSDIVDKYQYTKGMDALDNTIREYRDDIPQVAYVTIHWDPASDPAFRR